MIIRKNKDGTASVQNANNANNDNNLEKDTINIIFDEDSNPNKLQINFKDTSVFLFSLYNRKYDFYGKLPVCRINDIVTFNVVTYSSDMVNEILDNKLIREWFTLCSLIEFINKNLSYISGEKPIYIADVGAYKMVQLITQPSSDEMDALNVYYVKSLGNKEIIEDVAAHLESGTPFTKSELQIGFPIFRKKGMPYSIDFYKNEWYFSVEYTKDTLAGTPVMSKRDNFFEKIVYADGSRLDFSTFGVPLLPSQTFDMFAKNEKKDIEEIHSHFINNVMLTLVLHSQYTSFYNTYGKHTDDNGSSDKKAINIFDIEKEVNKKFEKVSIEKRTSQEFLKEQFEKAVVKYDVYPELLNETIKEIKEVYVRDDNPSVNNGFILKVRFENKKEIYFKIDDILTQGKQEYVEEMLFGYCYIIKSIASML